MFDIPKPKTTNMHESTWDHHGSYQWTYFADEIKQRIKFFLQQRLSGKNIEIGGGWYLSYPDSVVVDLSSVCLSHNPAKEKLQFDLDTIRKGNKLPYADGSFDSATLISVWQYLKHPEKVLRELERILVPGAEIYLINGQGGGLEECIVGTGKTESIQDFFKTAGYDTLIEHIPCFDGDVREFQSVCAAMPDKDLFGQVYSQIKNKEQRKKQDEEICQNPSIFTNEYIEWEMRMVNSRLSRLSSFPVTQYSREYLERIETFSQEYNKQTGEVPLIFIEHFFEPALAMLTPEYKYLHGTMFLMGVDKQAENFSSQVNDLLKKFELCFSRHGNYFKQTSITRLLSYCADFVQKPKEHYSRYDENEANLERFADFISSQGLNSFTRELQEQIYLRLKTNVPNLDKMMQKSKAYGYHFATYEYKQKRTIDELIKIKEEIMSTNVPVVETQKLNYSSLLSNIRQFVR
jgi:SAM-dependent methyltransferase